jgi:hypothetical protein
MRITEADKKFLKAEIEVLKAPELDSPPAQRLPEVIETVSKMLSEIEKMVSMPLGNTPAILISGTKILN